MHKKIVEDIGRGIVRSLMILVPLTVTLTICAVKLCCINIEIALHKKEIINEMIKQDVFICLEIGQYCLFCMI